MEATLGTITLYGKTGCATCKKARAFLAERGVEIEWREICDNPPPRSLLSAEIDGKSPGAYFNARATSYRKLGLAERVVTKGEAIRLMLDDPNLILRPIAVRDGRAVFGFDPTRLEGLIR